MFMGKIDISLSSYLSHPPVFADLFNAWLYGGRQVIDYRELQAEDPVQNRPEYAAAYKHVRDVVKMYYQDGMELVLLGIENQEEIDYTAPVRILQYDGADYQKKIRRVEAENRMRQVFGFLQRQDDRKALKDYVRENEDVFSCLSTDAALFLAAAAKGTRLLTTLPVKEETCNMCKALDDLYNDGVNQGLVLGEDCFAALSEKLLADLRMEDLRAAIKNKEYRDRLYKEYRIERC